VDIVVAFDGTEGAQRAARAAMPVARASGANFTLLHVIAPRDDLGIAVAGDRVAVEQAIERAMVVARDFVIGLYDRAQVRVELVEHGEAVGDALGRVSSALGADLIFSANRRAPGLGGFFLGSVTQQLIQAAPCPSPSCVSSGHESRCAGLQADYPQERRPQRASPKGFDTMNTMMGWMWIVGMILGLVYGFYSGGGVTAIAIIPLVGGTLGIILAMFIDEIRAKFRKKKH